MKIKSIKKIHYTGKVYNLGVHDNNNYYINNILVHNCYVNADATKKDYIDICETWKKWIVTFPEDKQFDINNINDSIIEEIVNAKNEDFAKLGTNELLLYYALRSETTMKNPNIWYTEKPFQIAIGSTGEPTIHPELPEFLKTVYETKVVPNYTTNGIVLSNYDKSRELLEATSNYCGGVAVSFGNKNIREYAVKAVNNLLKYGNCKVMLHHLISNKDSVDELVQLQKEWAGSIHYHVLLPLMAHGRSTEKMDDDTYMYLVEQLNKNDIKNVAFGANFLPFMTKHPNSLNVWEYPQEIYSKNILLKDSNVIITPSSYNLEPVKKINF